MNEQFMREAIELSREKMRQGTSGPFGAVVVKDNLIIGRGYNQVTANNDPTAHAEVQAIRNACQQLNTFTLSDCVIYTSCEPCPMCLGAIWWARIDKIVYAANRTDAAKAGFSDDDFYQELSKENHQRSVSMQELMRAEAVVTFDEWIKKTDKILY